MKDFPIEIIEDIIDYVDPRYLFSLRTTNRSMHAMVTPRAFRCIRVQDSIPLVRKRYNLLNDSHLAPLIEEVVYTEHSGGLEETPGQAENEDEKYSERLDAILYSFFSELHLLPSLSALTLMFWTRPVDNSEVPPNIAPRQASVIRGILPVDGSLRTLEANPQLMIKKLKIDGLFLVWMPIRINFLAMLSYFPKLCHVDVTFMRDSDVCSLFQHHRERMAHPFVISAPPWESTLSVLTLRADKGLSCLLGIDNCPAYFSQLSHLSLDRVRFGINDAVERFVLRHSSTLQYLQLCSCAAHIGRDPNDPVAGTRTWASIYSVFSLQLSSLIDLSVLTFYEHERLGEYVNAYGLDNGMQTLLSHPVSVPVPETQTQMDNDALLVFIRVVEDRKFRKRISEEEMD